MKCDWNLIYAILLILEEKGSAALPSNQIKIEKFSTEQIHYHCQLLYEREFISGKKMSNGNEKYINIINMTWEGHEFLDSLRAEPI
ncbi:hypothetical protein ADP71_23290 [Vitreoscilla sp. C1]|uniref:DUF2513 domain-containing protein n=1 Tax=Vitreoscilla sp. (strain C1) TaxID=96942 RepID=UPI000CDC45DE|nr:DUF2513 domain-containing protein [Vitreoscilla sp. C1]AUZ05696.1 hypothetical protein ADP71_23290 [Vitreoscilla sp. C1]